MTWSNPEYLVEHAYRDAIANGGALNSSGTPAAGSTLASLYDSRSFPLFEFNTATNPKVIDVNRGTGTLSQLKTFIMTAGHTIAGVTLDVRTDDNPSFSSAVQISGSPTANAGLTVFDLQASGVAADWSAQYVRLRIHTATVDAKISEIIMSPQLTTTLGPDQTRMVDQKVSNERLTPLSSGVIARLERGPLRRQIEYEYSRAQLADLDTLRAIRDAVRLHHPFWVYPARAIADGDDPVWVALDSDATSRESTAAPNRDTEQQRFALSMIEHLG